MTDPVILDLEPIAPEAQAAQVPALADNSPAALMLTAMGRGAGLEQIKEMMQLQREWEADEARKAYNIAFAAFQAEAIVINKNRKVDAGPLAGKSYAELIAVINAVKPALAKHGLSVSWKLTRDEEKWMEVTCTLKHVQGHSESVSMGGPPDTGGAKNAIQARASTKSYLERYTLKAICGVAEGGEDDDGNGGARDADWLSVIQEAASDEDLLRIKDDGTEAYTKARDVKGYAAFMRAINQRRAELKATK